MIPLNKPKIDSLRIRIPLSEVKINPEHREFLRTITTVNNFGEILEEKVNVQYFKEVDGVGAKYLVKSEFGNPPVLYIGFSSKLLKKSYFQGINKRNMYLIYDIIKSENLIEISKEQLLLAEVIDVDFCIDYFINSEEGSVKQLVDICYDLTKSSKDINVQRWKQPINKGIQWNRREGNKRAFKKKQFLKYYAKALELTNKSKVFYESHLKDELNETLVDINGNVISKRNKYFNLERLVRVETTIRNRMHFKSYGYNVRTLNDLLSLDLDISFLQIFKRPIGVYMTGYKEIQHMKEMTVGEKIKYQLCLTTSKLNKLSIEDSIIIVSHTIYPKDIRKKRDMKNQLFSIINMAEVGKKTHRHNTEHWNEFIEEIQAKIFIP